MKNILSIIALFTVVSLSSKAQHGVLDPTKQVQPSDPMENLPKGEVHWISFEQALEKSKKEKKKILIDLYTDWCGWCKVMDKKTYSIKVIADYINKNYYPVKFDAEQLNDITFKGKTFKHVGGAGRNGYHELAYAMLNGQMSYPSTVFMDEDFNMIQAALPGMIKPDVMEPILKYLNENKHLANIAWPDYLRDFKSELK
jgi:thioredoxin-related protein